MKFILNENKNFLLEERFVLTEASAAELTQKWVDQFKKTFDNVEASLNKYIEYTGLSKSKTTLQAKRTELTANFKDATADFEVSLRAQPAEINANIEAVKEELKSCITVLEAVVAATDSTDENPVAIQQLNSTIKALSGFYDMPAWKDSQIQKLKQLVSQMTEAAETVLDTSAIKADLEDITKFKETCDQCLELLATLKKSLPNNFTAFEDSDLVSFQAALKEAIDVTSLKSADTLNKGLVIANFERYQAQVETIKIKYTAILKSAVIKDYERASTGDKTDWKTKLAQAVNKENIIEEFIYVTWKAAAKDVLKLRSTLLPECEAYGFETVGDRQNPFVSYINNVYLKYKDSFSVEKYNAIHNLVSQGQLSGKDLAGQGVMGQGNLVFCKELYALDANVIKLYVKKQFNLLKAATKPDTFKDNAEMAFNALYKLPEIVTGQQTKQSAAQSLRTIADVEQLEAKWTGTVSDTAEEEPTKKIATNAELLKQISSTDNAIKVLAALAIKFSSKDTLVAAVQSCAEAKALMAKTTTVSDILKLVASVERLYKIEHINATQAMSLVKSILEAEQFNLTKE